MSNIEFQNVDIPQGRFIGWGKIGQKVTLRTLSYDPEGGVDFNKNTCPQLVGELTEQCDNYKDKGATHETIEGGELVTVTCGTANLKRGILAAAPTPGDFVQMEFTDTYVTPQGTGKVIQVRIARGAAPAPASTPSAPASQPDPF